MQNTTKCTLIGIAAAAVLPFGAGTAMAAPPPAEILGLQPVENDAFQVARIAPFTNGGAERWRVRAHFDVKNNGAQTIKLVKTLVDYPTGPGAIGTAVQDTDADPNVDSRDIAPGKSKVFIIEDGMARPTAKPGDRSLFFPVPTRMRIGLRFNGFSDTLIKGVPLHTYVNKTAQGSFLFPAKQFDLLQGQRWSTGIHAFSRTQKFAYDMGVSRWDKTKQAWTGLKPGTNGTKNSDYLIWGKRVYAMASGTIVKCTWSKPDNSMPGKKDSGGQNNFVIDHGNGEFALYAHLQAGTVNAALCPHDVEEGKYGLTIPVAAGQVLGRAGNSGNSTGPHLHVHVATGANGKPFGGSKGSGVPLLFRAIRNVSGNDKKTIGPGPFALNTVNGEMPGGPFNLIDLRDLPLQTP